MYLASEKCQSFWESRHATVSPPTPAWSYKQESWGCVSQNIFELSHGISGNSLFLCTQPPCDEQLQMLSNVPLQILLDVHNAIAPSKSKWFVNVMVQSQPLDRKCLICTIPEKCSCFNLTLHITDLQ